MTGGEKYILTGVFWLYGSQFADWSTIRQKELLSPQM